jgi:hypothetical protein
MDVSLSARLQPLLQYGDDDTLRSDPEQWRDYVAELGLTAEDVPQLLAVLNEWFAPPDDEGAGLDEGDDPLDAKWCAPIHAWRALGQLGAIEAVAPMLAHADPLDEWMDDWSMNDWRHVFGLIGPAAIDALLGHAADASHREFSRVMAIDGLEQIVARHPETRERVVSAAANQLSRTEPAPIVNGFLVARLLDWRATEAAESLERAYAADVVDESICGGWGEVREQLGVPGIGLASPERRPRWWTEHSSFSGFDPSVRHSQLQAQARKQAKRAKAKRKAAAQARKRNRRAK